MNLSKKEVFIVIILSLMTALVALSIDLYLPSFKAIAEDLDTNMGKVQISLSVFIAGLGIGQLLWGTLSDRFGRKIPTIVATVIYCIASLLVLTSQSIEEIWIYRFIQAFCGSAGMVIARAVVTDYFDKTRTIGIFSLLTLVTGIAPIVAPIIGNLLLEAGGWHTVFVAMGVMGALITVLIAFYLPETNLRKSKPITDEKKGRSVVGSYLHVLRNPQFVRYMIIASLAMAAMMVYIANSPFLIMEIGGFTGTQYSAIFGINALGMMLGTYLVNPLTKRINAEGLTRIISISQIVITGLMVFSIQYGLPIMIVLILIFFFLVSIGIISPVTTNLALEPFHNDSGSASALFGFTQQVFTFTLTAITGLIQNNSAMPMALTLLVCAITSILFSFRPAGEKEIKQESNSCPN